jgi:hypothetical protein
MDDIVQVTIRIVLAALIAGGGLWLLAVAYLFLWAAYKDLK